MVKRKHDTRWMAGVALTAAIVILLANTPLGMIPLPITKATTVHVPVILGAIVFGPTAGAILGGIFGICSVVSNTIAPSLTSFAFSPFMSTTGLSGAVKALWISVGCRILIGLVAAWLWIILKKIRIPNYIALPVVGFFGSMTNTVCVMGSIYLLLAPEYAEARNIGMEALMGVIMTTVAVNGVPEALCAMILVTAIGMALLRFTRAGKAAK